jgi:hypothetical protein
MLLLVAYGFEFIGVFLLAVEAIKAENLAKLRLAIGSFSHPLQPPPREGTSYLWFYSVIIGQIVVGALILWYFMRLTGLDLIWATQSGMIQSMAPDHSHDNLFQYLASIIVLLGGGIFVGAFTLWLSLQLLAGTVRATTWIDENTSSGVVGILGLLSYSVYIALKIIAGPH